MCIYSFDKNGKTWLEVEKLSPKIMRFSFGLVYLRKDITAFNVRLSLAGLAL